MPAQEVTRFIVGLVSDQTMIVTVIGGVLLFFVLVLSLLRYKNRMASLISWIISAITGSRVGTKESVEIIEDSEESSTEDKSKLIRTKVQQKTKKPSEEPEFSTSLSTPIEDVIEETITEERKSKVLQSSSRKKTKTKGQLNKQRTEDPNKLDKNQSKEEKEEDNIGYSFLKPKSPEAVKSEKVSKKKSSVKTNRDESSLDKEQDDEVGFSFFPVKEKGRRHKGKSALEKNTSKETLSTFVEQSLRKTKEDLSKPSIIDHYKKKETKQATSETVSGTSKKSISNLDNVVNIDLTTKLEENYQPESQNRFELRKSKIVSSSISYANVVTNSFIETKVDDANIELDTKKQVKEDNESQLTNVEEVESGNHISENLQTSKEAEAAEIQEDFKVKSVEESSDNIISKSNSSSIEVITEADFEQSKGDQTVKSEYSTKELRFEEAQNELEQFESTLEDINKIINSNSPSDESDQLLETVDKSEGFIEDTSQNLLQEQIEEVEDKVFTKEEISVEEQLGKNIQIEYISSVTAHLPEESQQEGTPETEDKVVTPEQIPEEDNLDEGVQIENISVVITQFFEKPQQESGTEEVEDRASAQETFVEQQLGGNIQIENILTVTARFLESQQEITLATEEVKDRILVQEESVEEQLGENIHIENYSAVAIHLLEESQQEITSEIEEVEDRTLTQEEAYVEEQLGDNISAITAQLLEELQQEKSPEIEVKDKAPAAAETFVNQDLDEIIPIEYISVITKHLEQSHQELILETEEVEGRVSTQQTSVEEQLAEASHIEDITAFAAELIEELQQEIISDPEEVRVEVPIGEETQLLEDSQEEKTLATEVKNTAPILEEIPVQQNLGENILLITTQLLEESPQDIPSETEEIEDAVLTQEEIPVKEHLGENIQKEGISAVTAQLLEELQQEIRPETEKVKEETRAQEETSIEQDLTENILAVTTKLLEESQQDITSEEEGDTLSTQEKASAEQQLVETIQTGNISAVTAQVLEESEPEIIPEAEGKSKVPAEEEISVEQNLGENIQAGNISAVTTQFLEESQQDITSESNEIENREPQEEITAETEVIEHEAPTEEEVSVGQENKEPQEEITAKTEVIEHKAPSQEGISVEQKPGENIQVENISTVTTQLLEKTQQDLTSEPEEVEDRTFTQETFIETQLSENILVDTPQLGKELASETEEIAHRVLTEEKAIIPEIFQEDFSSTVEERYTSPEISKAIENFEQIGGEAKSSAILTEGESKSFPTYLETVNTIVSESSIQEPLISNPLDNLIDEIQSAEANYIRVNLVQKLDRDNLKEESSKLIEEEKCVKKVAYTTGSSVPSPQTLKEISTADKSDKNSNMTLQQIRVLTLNNQEHQECTLYRIEKNWVIQFRLGPSLFGRRVYLYCNYPVENNGRLAEFNRNQYQLLNWVLDEGCKNADDTAAYTQITAKLAGSFHYYFTFENGENAERHGSGYFLVDPILKYGNNEELLLDCIQCQTVLAKNLGSFSSWEKKLQVAKESGYNMIHFSPIQELGISNSSYSISEQLKLNPEFKKENGEMPTFEEVEEFISKIRREWKVTSICDIVLNHTANESEWIQEHPEVTYNCVNCPYMRPAYLLDAALHQFSIDVKKCFYEDKGIPAEINSEEHLNAIRYHFPISVLEPLKLQELYICDVNELVREFLSLARVTTPVPLDFKKQPEELKLIQDPEYKRLAAAIDMTLAQRLYNVYRNDTFDEESRLKKCAEDLKNKLDSLNKAITEKINAHLSAAIDNVIASIRYFRVQADGPRVKEISVKNPLAYRYFTDYATPKSLKEHEEIMYSNNGCFLMAHNGWVMNSDPLKNFAAPGSNVYIRRELIAWGDSVKLRFGDKPNDCPFLWEQMKKYVEETAKIFDGVRLDNCHSTPIPVAEYLLDSARKVKPDLYVVAELFTNSDLTDNIFVNRLGISSLIREAMSAWDSHEEGRLVYRYGGYPVGSFYQPSIRPLVPSIAHALFLDLTHDNPSPVEKRSVFDLLPSTALVNMACCASGSNRGYDELVPHHIHVVDETRQYTEWTEDENLAMGNLRYVTNKSGIIAAKRAINNLHFTLGKEGFNQVYVDQMDPDIVAVTRHNPETHQSYILVAFTSFRYPNEDAGNYQRGIKPLRVEGVLEEIVLEATLSHVSYKTGGSMFAKWDKYVKDSKWINGLSEYQINVKQHIQVNESEVFEKVDSGKPNVIHLNFKHFKPGSIVVVKVSLPQAMRESVKTVRNLIGLITRNTELSQIINKLTLADLNRIIYRCGQEERDEGFGFDTYFIPNFGFTVYAGLQGFMSLLANIRPNNDLGHPMCCNLRDGNWMIEYIWRRLELDEGTRELGQWIEEHTKCFNNIPRYLVPCYFDAVITGIYICLIEQCYKLMSDFVNHGSTFVRGLSLGSVQFAAYIKSADLPTLLPNLAPPKPPTRTNDKGETVQACVTSSAGLPHFAVGYMRNWGRDTFIALRGLFILTGRYEEARQQILGYAACLRHGLIPNLLDGGRNSRFNCRDAVWWWLHCIKDYVEDAPNGITILNDSVSRIFPTDDSPAQPPGVKDQPLYEIMQEALTVHFQGLAFRERNAGRQIDEHMTDRGFNNQIGIHPETGFVFGGNEWNCGTWMDKMGSSDKAGNRGKPATPRDGSAIELIGLSKAVVTWLSKLSQENKYPYSYVQRTHKNGSVTKWTFKEWSDKIQANFEKYFWISVTPAPNEIGTKLIHKRGIYKDCHGASQDWSDFQLRCNFPIAMVVAPELFTPQQAWTALNQAEKYLLGPLGMKTLDPEDWVYRGDYDNTNDSDDPSVAHGFNYHQGPEWVWPLGFFLRAKLHFANLNGALKETLASTKLVLSKHFTELQTSPWRGLPELTNSNGSYCNGSSRTQAWSMACILEVLNDLQKIESAHPVLVN